MSDIKNKAIKGFFWSTTDILSKYGLNFIIQIVLARLLLPEDFGIIGMITIFITISQSLIDSGFSSALIREKAPTQSDFSTVFFFNLVTSITLYSLLFFSSDLIGIFFSEPKLPDIIKILSLVIIINSFGLIQRTILIRNIDFKTQTKVSIISSVFSGIISILLAYLGFGVWSLVVRTIIMQLLQAILLSLHNKWIPIFDFNRKSFIRLFSFGWKIMVSGLINTLYLNVYTLIIGKFFTTIDLGFYTNARQITDVAANTITISVQKVSYPILSSINEEPYKILTFFKKTISGMMFINCFLMFFLIGSADSLIPFVFGENWLPSVPYFKILCASKMLFPLHVINLNILQVKGRSDLFLKLEIIKKAIGASFITLAIVFDLGITGLLWTGVISSVISFFINSHYSDKLLGYSTWNQIKDIFPAFIISLTMGFVVYLTGSLLKSSYFIELLIQLALAIVIYISLSKLFNINEITLLLQLIKKRKSGSDKIV